MASFLHLAPHVSISAYICQCSYPAIQLSSLPVFNPLRLAPVSVPHLLSTIRFCHPHSTLQDTCTPTHQIKTGTRADQKAQSFSPLVQSATYLSDVPWVITNHTYDLRSAELHAQPSSKSIYSHRARRSLLSLLLSWRNKVMI